MVCMSSIHLLLHLMEELGKPSYGEGNSHEAEYRKHISQLRNQVLIFLFKTFCDSELSPSARRPPAFSLHRSLGAPKGMAGAPFAYGSGSHSVVYGLLLARDFPGGPHGLHFIW